MWRADVFLRGDQVTVEMELPGVDPGELRVALEPRTLRVEVGGRGSAPCGEGVWLRRERWRGPRARVLYLPLPVAWEEGSLRLCNGLLVVQGRLAASPRALRCVGSAPAPPHLSLARGDSPIAEGEKDEEPAPRLRLSPD